MQKKIGCFNEGLPQLTSPGGKERRKLINQSSSATYLHPRYGAASLGMASFTGVTTPGEANKCATRFTAPMGLMMHCSISAFLSILTCSLEDVEWHFVRAT
ncbi:hypothetical protein Tco_0305855 [Tanacetum coccineum]